MLPLKMYNNLPLRLRTQIVRIVFGHMGDNFITQMATPFRHRFDYGDGHWYKLLLSHCNYNKEKKQINVTVHIPYEE